jgi:hypothetical protein
MPKNYVKLADLAAELNTKTLMVVPALRPYISQADAGYDYHVGHEFTVQDHSSPLTGCRITVCDRHTLKKTYGVTHLDIKFNPGMAPLRVAL